MYYLLSLFIGFVCGLLFQRYILRKSDITYNGKVKQKKGVFRNVFNSK